jgi:hypothetical protein
VISHSLWKRAFAGDHQAVGRELWLNGREELALRVVGVMPPGFSGHSADRVDLWIPLSAAMRESRGWDRQRSMAVVEVGVRLAAGTTPEIASSHLTTAIGLRTILWPIIGADIAPAPHQIAYCLAAVSMVVFLIGLANSATLLLVGGTRQRRERSIRSALGATRRRLLRVVWIESSILAAVAGGVALILAWTNWCAGCCCHRSSRTQASLSASASPRQPAPCARSSSRRRSGRCRCRLTCTRRS